MKRLLGQAFFAGGIITTAILLWFRTFAKAMVGMGDGAAEMDADFSSLDKLIVLLCAYFFISAVGLVILKNKKKLWICAILSHCLLLTAYVLILFVFKNPNGYTWHSDSVKASVFIAVYYFPWVTIWFFALMRKNRIKLPTNFL